MKLVVRYFKEVLFGKYYLEERRLVYWTLMFFLLICTMLLLMFARIGRMILLALALCFCFGIILVSLLLIFFNIIELRKSFKLKMFRKEEKR